MYAPGATLDPACAPTDTNCGVSSSVASSTANSVPYYAANGSILSATSSLTILSNGNIGVGTTSPYAQLSIAGSAGGTTNLFAISTSTAGYATSTALYVSQNGNLYLYGNGAGEAIGYNTTPPGNGLIVSGNVGIGTTSPSAALTVQGSTDKVQLLVKGNSTQTNSLQQWQSSNGTALANFVYDTSLLHASLHIPSNVTGKGPFNLGTGEGTFNGTIDPVFTWGYNADTGGTLLQSGENALNYNIEGDYNDGTNHTMETYIQYTSASGSVSKRPFFWQINRATNAITSASIMGAGGASGGLNITYDDGSVGGAAMAQFLPSVLMFSPSGGMGTHVQQLEVNSTLVGYLMDTGVGGSAGAVLAIGSVDQNAVGTFDNAQGNVAEKGLVVRGKSGQTGDLFEAQDSNSIPLAVINKSGNLGIGTTSPYSLLSISNNKNTAANTPLFTIASTTGGTSTTTLMTVLANGNLGIGTTSPATKLEVGGDITDDNVLNCSTLKTDTNGKINCVSSDERLKQNIAQLGATNSLTSIEALNPVSFYWKDPTNGTQQQLGFIAQDVQQIFPELVGRTAPTALTPDGTLTLNYLGLIAPLVKAVQELASVVTGFAQSFTSQQITASQQLCVGSTCITESQLKAILQANGQQADAPQASITITNVPSSPDNTATSTGSTATSTSNTDLTSPNTATTSPTISTTTPPVSSAPVTPPPSTSPDTSATSSDSTNQSSTPPPPSPDTSTASTTNSTN